MVFASNSTIRNGKRGDPVLNTMADPILHAASTVPDRLAVACNDVRLTYTELYERCRRLASSMSAMGMQRGDRIAILAANSHQYIEYYVALPAFGFVIVPLNTRHATPELEYALKDGGVRILITDRDPGMLADCVERVISLPDEYESLIGSASDDITLGDGISENDLAGLFYTGGTTGASKGVMLSHRNLIANTFHTMGFMHPKRDSAYLVMAPLFHAAGSTGVLASIWTGGVQVIVSAFNPGQALDLIEQEKITESLGVPTMIAAMTELQLSEPRDVSTLRLLAHGGSPIASEVVRRAHRAFPQTELIHVYGCTETAPLVTGLRDEQLLTEDPRIHSCGQALPGVAVRIVNDDNNALATGQVGEVAVRGANVMQGYWNKKQQTSEVLRDGWYLTGDLGSIDGEGNVYLVDRKKDMIVSGGENVYSTEVEDILYRHPAVLEAAVFGIPDEKWGEAVHAVVVPRKPITADELIAHCRQSLGGYKVPRSIDFQSDELPKSGPGKILKRELRAPYWEGGTRRIN